MSDTYVLVDCDECEGTGRMEVAAGSDMNQVGWPVGHYVCDRCGGIGKHRHLEGQPNIWQSLAQVDSQAIWIEKVEAAGRAMLERLVALGEDRGQWLDAWPWLRDDEDEDWGEDFDDDDEDDADEDYLDAFDDTEIPH